MQMSPGYVSNNPADAETRKSLQEANMELKKLEENKDMMIRIEQQKLFVRFLENEMRKVDIDREVRGVSGGVHNSFSKRFVGNFTLDDKPASTEVISEENVNKESEYMQSAVDNVKEVITSVAGSVPADAGATGGPDDESGGLYTKTLEAAKSSGESINKFIQGFTQSVSEGDTTSNTSGTLPAWPPPGVEVATIRDVDENGNPIQTSWLDVAKKFASGAASSYSETSKKFMETYGKDSETGDSIDPISGVIRKASGMLPQDVGESDLKLMRLLESEVEGGTLTEERLEELRKDYPNEFDTLSARTQSAISLGYSAVTGNKRRPEDPESFLQSLGTASNVDFSSVTGYTNPYGFESISGLAMGVNAQEDVNLGAPNPFMEKLGEVSIRLQDLAMKGKDAIMRSATAVAEYLRSCGIDVGDFSSISELFGGSFGDIAGRLGGSASSTYNNFFGGGNAGGRSTTEKTPVNQTGLKTDRYFLKDLVNVSNRMNMDPIALLAVMESESNVNPKSFNSAGPAGGLIQFTPTGLESINSKLSPTDITNLGWREQLKLSEQFLRKNAGGKPFNRIEDAKLAVFAPAHMGKPPAATVYGKNDKVPRYYRANKTLDYNNDGKITVAEVGDRVTRIYNTMAEWDIWKELGVTPRHLGEGKSSGAYEFGNMSDVGPVSFPTEGSGNWPAPNYINTVTSLYGMRKGKMHEGVDIAGDPSNTSGQPAFTMWPGVVSFVGEFGGGGGNTVMVKHPDSGLTTVYMHLKDIAVETGETVDAKDKIGTIGATGGNYRPHLHFEIWKGDRDKAKKRGASIDPLEAFQSMGSVYSVTQKAYKESQGKPPTQDYGTKTWDYKAEESSTDYKEHKPHKTDSWEERLKGVEVAMVGPAVDTNATGGPRSMGRPKSRTQRAGNSGSSSSNGKKKKTPFGWSPVVKEMFTGKKSTTPATNNEDRMTHQEYSILSEATNSMRTRLEDMGYEWERNRGMVPKKEKPKTEEEWDGKTFRIGKDIEVTLIDPYVYYGQDEGLDPPETSVQFLLKDKKRIAKLYVDIDRGKVIPPSKQKGPNGSGNAVFDEFTKSSAELNKMRNELEIYGYTWDENKGMIHISELPRKPGETWNGSTFTKDTTIREYLGNPYVYPGYSEGYLPTQKALSLIERDKKQIPKLLEDVKSGRIEKPMLEEYMVPMTPTEIPLYKSPKTPNVQSGAMGNRTQPAGATNKTHSESNMTTSTTTGKDLTVGSGSGQGSSPASDWKVLSSYSGPARTQESPRETTTNNPISDMMVKMQAAMSSLTTQMSQTNTSRVTEAIGSAAQQTSESVANVVISTTNAIRSSSNNTTTSQGSQGGSGSGPANKVLDIENELVNILLRGRTRI
jgi:murein DD-endopeptidase MepM/ murein hydrolase activator NlpD